MLRTRELDYELPPELIATRAMEPREAARMLVARRAGDAPPLDRTIRDLPVFLNAGDVIVLNTTRVLPAWLEGYRAGTNGKWSGLYLGPAEASGEFATCWRVMLKAGHLRPGVVLGVQREGHATGVRLHLIEVDKDEAGAWVVGVEVDAQFLGTGGFQPPVQPGARERTHTSPVGEAPTPPPQARRGSEEAEGDSTRGAWGCADTPAILDRIGTTPIPPYIRQARKAAAIAVPDAEDRELYQTMFADAGTIHDGLGSVAAPTAGLHLTPAILGQLAAKGVRRADVVLHVGTGTFRPVEVDVVEDHPIHAEWCSMSREAIGAVRACRAAGGRVVCVGTTSARTVESYAGALEGGEDPPAWLSTRLLITPGYRWRWTDGLLTNFHLPRSTLLALVGAMFESGIERARALYTHAVRERYRFYSYGDAMLIMP